jgi:hypothetical protein
MFRNLKLAASAGAAALAAVCALGLSSAQAAEFHCSVEPCRVTVKPDGTGKTRHQVFVIGNGSESISFTCNEVSGEGTPLVKTSLELTISKIEYQTCAVIGTAVAIKMNGCDYLLTAEGKFSIKCPPGQKIEWNVLGCTATIGAQGPLSGVKFSNISSKSEITMETAVKGIKGTLDGPECVMKLGEFTAGEIVTGNVILTAETDNAEAKMASFWWE